MAKHGKKFRAVKEKAKQKETYELAEAFQFLKDNQIAKFNESIDIAMRLGVNPHHADQIVRGTVNLPHGTGKTKRVIVFTQGEKIKEAEEAGADAVGAENSLKRCRAGGWSLMSPSLPGFYG